MTKQVNMLALMKGSAPQDWKIIDMAAREGLYFYDGPGVIMPSGTRYDGMTMRALVDQRFEELPEVDRNKYYARFNKPERTT